MTDTLFANPVYLQASSAFLGAFMAFCFFVVGEIFVASRRKRDILLAHLNDYREYLSVLLCEAMIMKEKISQVLSREEDAVSIGLSSFRYLPVKEAFTQNFSGFSIVESMLKLSIHIRMLDDNVQVLNRHDEELSSFSKIAMLDGRSEEFRSSLAVNRREYSSNVREQSISLNRLIDESMPRLFTELDYTEMYVKAYFWTKWYYAMRSWADTQYRDKRIESMAKQKKESAEVPNR